MRGGDTDGADRRHDAQTPALEKKKERIQDLIRFAENKGKYKQIQANTSTYSEMQAKTRKRKQM